MFSSLFFSILLPLKGVHVGESLPWHFFPYQIDAFEKGKSKKKTWTEAIALAFFLSSSCFQSETFSVSLFLATSLQVDENQPTDSLCCIFPKTGKPFTYREMFACFFVNKSHFGS